jgi:ADP-glucose pyrophosphorylase
VVRNSILLPSSSVGRGCRLENAIVTPGCQVPDGTAFQAEEAAIIPAGNDGDDAE